MGKAIQVRSISKLPIPWYYKILAPLINLIGEKQTFRIVITSPDYLEINVLFGLFKYEKGQKYEIIIQGTERFAEIITNSLKNKGFRMSK